MGMVIRDRTESVGGAWCEVGTLGVGIRTGHVPFHEVNCDRVQAARRNYAAGKQRSVSVAD